jgi:hypothetical protein
MNETMLKAIAYFLNAAGLFFAVLFLVLILRGL